jgi:hypothetical protein
VREEFRDLIGEGLSTEQATDKLLREYAPSLDGPDDGPMTIAAIWKHVREKGGENSAAPLAEIDAPPDYLHNNAYPFVGKDSWKSGIGHPAIVPSGDSIGMWQVSRCAEMFVR